MAADSPFPQTLLRQWRLIGGIFAVLSLVLAAWYFFGLRQDFAILYRDLRPSEAAAIAAALDDRHIAYRISEDSAQILAHRSEIETIRAELSQSQDPLGGVEGFELFDSSDMGLTDFAQKIRYQRALQGELTRTIMLMDGVAEARVHISIPERALFRSERREASAAITLIMRSPSDETPDRIEGVQRLVAASVSDLPVNNVVVLNALGEVISARPVLAQQTLSSDAAIDGGPSDWARAIIGQAIPGLPFDVSQTSVSLEGADGPPPTPGFSVLTQYPLSEAEQQQVRAALERAALIPAEAPASLHFEVGPLPVRADEIAVPVQSAPLPREASNAAPSESNPPDRSSGAPSIYWIVLAGIILVMALAAFAARYLAQRPTLTSDDHEAFAESLRRKLALQTEGP